MIDFIEYVVSELKNRRLSKENAVNLIRQFSGNAAVSGGAASLHPLLHRNISDIYQQCYRSSFTGDEFFLSDHQVLADGGAGAALRVLPGVAYLEMARAALADAMPGAGQVILSDVVWVKPLVVSERKDVCIALSSGGDAIEFEIFTEEADGEEVVHCRGTASNAADEVSERLDVAALTARMTAGQLDAGVVYPAYRAMGMQFGPGHQAVTRVYRGEREVVAHLNLPASVMDTLGAYELHPSLVDGALQSAIGLLGDLRMLPSHPSLPFALESVRVLSSCKQQMVAWIRHAQGASADGKVTKLDIDLCDAEGNVCVQLRGFSSRTLSVQPDAIRQQVGLVLANPVWTASPRGDVRTGGAQRHVVFCDLAATAAPDASVHHVTAPDGDMAQRYTGLALGCFDVVRDIIANKTLAGVFIQLVVADAAQANLLAGLSGLLKSAALEHSDVKGQLLIVDALAAQEIHAEPAHDAVVRYRNNVREVMGWEELHDVAATPAVAFKEGGVYLITGGLGGLGSLFAQEILRQTVRARVVLTGRSELSQQVQDKRDALSGDGRVEYRALDLTQAAQVQQLVAGIVATHGQLNGILHSAGMIADSLIVRKTRDEFAQVLAPKVAGTVNLDAASQDVDLDFMALFSSGASVMGNVGQADYAVANGFLDQFAAYRNGLAAAGQRKGRTVAINWPLWAEGGMSMPQHDQDAMREHTGMHPMQTRSGMQAFLRCLEGQQQTVVIEGDVEKIRQVLFEQAPVVAEPAAPVAARPAGNLQEQTRDYLRKQFADLFKLPYSKVDPRAALEKYGIDSILSMDLTRQLEKTFGSLSKTLFFEHQTINELTEYFMRSHASTLAALFSVAEPVRVAPPPAAVQATPRKRAGRGIAPATPGARHDEPIAIVGLSGRYPESADLDAFWNNLRDGKDCIVEVPKERWDWRDYYSEDRTAEGCHYSKWGGFISGVDEFDPLFFNIPPVDAEMIDPQERLFLQHTWMAIEDAGYTRAALKTAQKEEQTGQVGVYVGVMYGEYQLFGAEASLQGTRVGVPVSYASIANRVSYILNLHGPSMTLDTMCSSSLTAIHLACQDLKQGRTHLAIAGGVNVSIHPNKYLILSAGQFISSDGHCQSFGEGGDGYIPGEGVGAVVLKRLSDAERDGNHIYGVIKGSALNHGGKTNGYSVPNPKAQASVIGLALKEYGIDARHVSYIEAHGTGTKLGDPIEIAALSQVFGEYTKDRQFCAIGSAKSNIGHCESAAGIAGLTKVLLQMKHRMIVPSLHSSVLNPYIDFESSPFVVNQTLRAWDQPEVDGKRVPRIAGISSFGAGGSNAHLIIEEYAAVSAVAPQQGRVVIVLSARTPAQLKRKASDLLEFVERQEDAVDLDAMAYTLQVGREVMDARLAVVVDSVAQLAEKLAAFGRGDDGIDQFYLGHVDKDKDSMSVLSQDDDMMETIAKWIARKKLPKLAELWVNSLEIDWRQLHTGRKPTLISLPAYPFARDRYWISRTAGKRRVGGAAPLHPLVHANTSDFFEQSYSAQFSGDEFFLADHRIGATRQKILPGVAYLEMVRAAVDLAMPAGAQRTIAINNVAWTQPIVVDGAQEVTVALAPRGESVIDFEVHTGDGDGAAHCQGQVVLSDALGVERIDLDALRAGMTLGGLGADAAYDAFKAMNIHYGPSFRCMTALARGEGQALAELTLQGDADAFMLHPGMLDSALQASIGLVADIDNLPKQPSVPFALDSIVVHAPFAARMFAWVRRAGDKTDIDLCDQDGTLCARLTGLASRTMQADDIGTLIAVPRWETAGAAQGAVDYRRHVVMLCDLDHLDADRVPGMEVRHVAADATQDAAARYNAVAIACFEQVQAMLKSASHEKILFQLVIGGDSLLAGLSGLIDTARLENPNLVAQLIVTEPDLDETALAAQLRQSMLRPGESMLKHAGGMQTVLRWTEQAAGAADVAFKDGGVYMITGGTGGLGLVFAREIIEKAADAVVVLTGRAAEHALPALAGRVVYRQLDLTQPEQVRALVAGIVTEFGALNGIIHSAGMTRDSFIINKTSADFAQVLAPKVAGTVNLDAATSHLDLDFMVLFSSVASAMGNAGQADYAAANGFMDHFAAQRKNTVSINWPLWQDGGMQLDADTLAMLATTSGMLPLSSASGMQAFYRSLDAGAGQVLVIEGHLKRLRRALEHRHAPVVVEAPAVTTGGDSGGLLESAEQYLVNEFAGLLKMPAHEVDPKAPMEQYGMDSVLAMKLTNQLERTFGSLSKTLFFEYQTIARLAGYLVKAFPEVVRAKTGAAAGTHVPAPIHVPAPVRVKMRFAAPAPKAIEVAIVGVGGRYPLARDLSEFWQNLKSGRDCITEIPEDRWDHAQFYTTERNQPGKAYSKWGGFIDGVDQFDALFFNISPKEAELIDPQERLFIETVWETIEDAGYSKDAIARNRVGVYVGVMWGQYELYGAAAGAAGSPSSSFASIANRVSYFFNFQGPSLALDTMCSSSLTAIHLATEEVRKGGIDVAIAGGVNVSIHPSKYLSLSQGNFASTDGRCRSFGDGGDGYVPGEGVGAVLLKPLEKAIADGDQIYAIVKSSAINHGGKTNGYTVPNPVAQSELILDALNKANIDPATISYIETHGTGTSLGDPIEVTGLVQAFDGTGRPVGKQVCPIGSVKSNIGHLESAAGIAAVTKVLLQMKHDQLVPSLHAEQLNPHIDFPNTPFYVQTALQEWKRPENRPRRVGVSSFGAGGSNAHLILEDFVDTRAAVQRQDRPHTFVMSARNRDGLLAYADTMIAFLGNADDLALADIAFTSQLGRTAMQERLAIVAGSKAELKEKLQQWRQHGASDDVWEGSTKGGARASAHEHIAAQWVSGVDVDWAQLHGTERPQRVSLPTYPFARERFWIAAGPAPVQQVRKQLLHYRTEWRAAQPVVAAEIAAPLLVIGADAALFAQMERLHPGATQDTSIVPAAIVHFADAAGSVENGIFAMHALCQGILKQKPANSVRIVSVRTGTASAAQHRGMAGYLKSLAMENPAFSWKTISIDDNVAQVVSDELRDAHWSAGEVRYRGTQREVRELLRLPASGAGKAGTVIKQNGVYIITGGMGGLGEVFSQYLVKQYGARLVLIGRSAPVAGQRLSENVIYVQADIADRSQVDALVREAKTRFGRIDGVIHSAGIHRDAFVLNKTRAEMEAVFAAKVNGTINLDLATKDEDLDLFVTFSSVAGALGNVGQSDYAFANAFMDGYAEQRKGPGKSLSINWPLWQDGGMQLSPSDVALMEERSGLSPLPSSAGVGFFESVLQAHDVQAIALYGDAGKIDAYLARAKAPSPRAQVASMDAQPLADATEHYLKTLLSEQIKLSVERIDAQERFESFGVDSMMISRINADLERDLGELPKTLFYEYATIEELAGYLVQHAQAALLKRFDVPAAAPVTVEAPAAPVPAPAALVASSPAEDLGAIAIIGVNGQFPQSSNLAEFWENLSAGRDLIEPVPHSRWDAAGFFSADPANAQDGKIYCTSGGFLDDFDKFDAAFFSVSPDDARMIDPQERMFIQSVWGAVEDAGYTRDSLKKRHPKAKSADVGVFVGVTTNSYHLLTADEWSRGNMVNPASMPWSIANRVSYFFDFQGPSMPVDTACSSALVAIHLACESLKRKDCQVAVAGGVNLYLHPAKYQSLCRKRMLAVDGKCRSFGDGDDGFIPGEGVGAFVLKPLARAVADNDYIYGVVAASAYEHSGRSNGYSAPNPNSQAVLIEQVMNKAGVTPDQLGYVEGHGTGTKLGDSLEVLSMTQAFRKRTQNKAFCPLGSVKANVGHAESAAGIAGVAKILLQFKHRQLAPTIHSDVVNPNIDFANSPFYLQHGLTPWTSRDGQARRALINSFGAGGVNACMILEEYQRPPAQPACAGKAGYLMVLSARDEARLKERAAQLRDYLTTEREIDLAALSYTLQVGREAMDERLALVVASAGELLSGLSAYTGGKPDNAVSLATLEPHRKKKGPNQEERGRVKALFDSGDLNALLAMWIEGRIIEWDDFYRTERPVRLPLPSYPFAKERYWVSDTPGIATTSVARQAPAAQLHPLVSSNASTLRETGFASSLSGDEFYGRDHQVNGERFFPGAGFLELACVTGTIAGEESVIRIEDIVWVQPLKLGKDAQQVKTFLKAIGSSTEFVIVSFDDDNERVVHAEGRMSHGPASRHPDSETPAYSIAQLKQRAGSTVQGVDCYSQLASAGFHYGPCFQTIQELHIGSDFVLSRLQLADELLASFDQYILHPSLIDGALQTVVGMAAGETPDTPYLPFALDEVEMLRPLTETCYAYVEHAGNANAANQDIKQFNISLLSESGDVLVRLNNFYLRALPSMHTPQSAGASTLVLPE